MHHSNDTLTVIRISMTGIYALFPLLQKLMEASVAVRNLGAWGKVGEVILASVYIPWDGAPSSRAELSNLS